MQLRRFFQNEKNVIFPDLLILMMNLSLIRQRQLNILLYGQLGQFFFWLVCWKSNNNNTAKFQGRHI